MKKNLLVMFGLLCLGAGISAVFHGCGAAEETNSESETTVTLTLKGGVTQ